MTSIELADRLRRTCADASAPRLLEEAAGAFGEGIVASSSFQSQSVPLLHMIGRVCPSLPVYFLDTGFHFPETLRFRDELAERFGLNVVTVRPSMDRPELFERVGSPPWKTDPDRCCRINKIDPMESILTGNSAWISGVRADQTAHRNNMERITAGDDGLVRIHPLLNWSARDVWRYVHDHDLPVHPLLGQGYLSIGCAPCTRPPSGPGERTGRWSSTTKTECGLHTELGGTSK
ncbi:MAG: phosphoadenylyl-sulfate reductase [Rhodothermales bacterium]|nr:phosphoadenylyl-sulfate reductase [Rhodothermales bacterium]